MIIFINIIYIIFYIIFIYVNITLTFRKSKNPLAKNVDYFFKTRHL